MEFQIAEAIELIKTLAETENLTQSQALTAFVAETGMVAEDANYLKAALFETYSLQEMASDSLTSALRRVFVEGVTEVEDIHEVDTKETQEGRNTEKTPNSHTLNNHIIWLDGMHEAIQYIFLLLIVF